MRGPLLIISAVGIFTLMWAFVKAAGMPPGQSVFFRSTFAVPVIFAWLWWTGHLHDGLRTSRPWGHLARALAGTCAMGLGFAGLNYLPLPDVTAIRFITPIMVVLLAAAFLGERFRLVRTAAVITGFLGVLIVLSPSLGARDASLIGAALTLGSAAMAALAQIFVKRMAGTETTAAIVFYFSVTAAALSVLTLPTWQRPEGLELWYLIGAGLLGGVGQICLTSSYKFAEASTLAPFTYSSMIWAILLGWFWFGDVPTWQVVLGSSVIIASGAAIVWRERQLGRGVAAEGKMGAKGD